MKRIPILTLLILSLFTAVAQQQTIAGTWEGKLNVGAELRIVFHFEKKVDGSYAGSMDSPDQGAKGIPLNSVVMSGENLTAYIKSIQGSYTGSLKGDSVISGNWNQGNASFPLTIRRVNGSPETAEVKKTQTPKPPFSYASEDVVYTYSDQSIQFGGTFTFPKTGGPFPTAMMITGSGQEDRDETIFGHKPFAVIADYLTKKGYAVLRVDDRDVGTTTGKAAEATSADFANDVETGLAWLKTRKEVDVNKIGLIGHSEGGLIASILAARHKDIDFIVMLASPGIKGIDLLTGQMEAYLNSSGTAPEASAAYKPLYHEILEFVITEKDSIAAFAKVYPAFLNWKKQQPAAVLEALHMSDDSSAEKMIRGMIKKLSVAWMKYFLASDPQPMIQKFRCKVLALNGSKDIQVLPVANLAGIRFSLAKSKSKTYQLNELEGLNHLFQHCKACSVSEYAQLEETFAPEALDIMGRWLDENVLREKKR